MLLITDGKLREVVCGISVNSCSLAPDILKRSKKSKRIVAGVEVSGERSTIISNLDIVIHVQSWAVLL